MQKRLYLEFRLRSIVLIFIIIIISSEFLPAVNINNMYPEKSNLISMSDEPLADHYLFAKDVTQTDYLFSAKKECFILVEIQNIGFTSFTLDAELYEVSYGINILTKKFEDDFQNHRINIDLSNLNYFKSITVEPIILAEGIEETTLNADTEVEFKAGQYITILTRPTFSYNWLYLTLENSNGESILIKDIYDTAIYPEIDSFFYCFYIEQGTYIRFDITLDPDIYTLKIRGNGTLEYKIMVNLDWDKDNIQDVDEVQKDDLYDFELNPTKPDIWGFFQKSEERSYLPERDVNSYLDGYFTFYIPESYGLGNYLWIDVHRGEFTEMVIDSDNLYFKDIIFYADENLNTIYSEVYRIENPGWHHISYKYRFNNDAEINFRIGSEKIKVLDTPEFRDSDGDGIKDVEEVSNGLNRFNSDSDNDGLPDNVDASPLASLTLNKNKIYQIVSPVDPQKDTIITMQIKKPNRDYSTYNSERFWRNALNVTIYPVLRLFGNVKQIDESSKIAMNRELLENTWGKDVELLFKSDDQYSESGVGDPFSSSEQENTEIKFIFPKPSENSFEYEISLPKNHPAKYDHKLDLRFDFIWVVIMYDSVSNKQTILHFYDFEEDITVQTMIKREISNIRYKLASPDSFIENQILWALTQNPATLGTPADFNVADDIINEGTVDYLNLAKQTMLDMKVYYQNHPTLSPENEVIYITGLFDNYDVLNKIKLKSISNPTFEMLYQGDSEAYFSSYAINNVYLDQNYNLGDLEIQGETKILYQTSFFDYSTDQITDIQQRANINGIPIDMEIISFSDSKILKITDAQGFQIPLDDIPYSIDSYLNDGIMFHHHLYIEKARLHEGIPLLKFDQNVDIYKEFFDNRIKEVNIADLFFRYNSPLMEAEIFNELVKAFWEELETKRNNLKIMRDFATTLHPDPAFSRVDLGWYDSALNLINEMLTSKPPEGEKLQNNLENYKKFINFGNKLEEYIENIYDVSCTRKFGDDLFYEILKGENYKYGYAIGTEKSNWSRFKKGFAPLEEHVKEMCRGKDGEPCPLPDSERNAQMKGTTLGSICIVLGALALISGIIELMKLESDNKQGVYEDRELEYSLRLISAWVTITLGITLIVYGVIIILLDKVVFKTAVRNSLTSAAKWLGRIVLIITILLLVIDVAILISRIQSGDVAGYELIWEVVKIAIAAILFVGVALGAISLGWSIVISVIVVAIDLLGAWLAPYYNHPKWEIEDGTGFELPEDTQLNVRRHCGLEVGDEINLHLEAENSGDRPVWFRADYQIIGGDWNGWEGRWGEDDWEDYYWPSDEYSHNFESTIGTATPNLEYRIKLEMDWELYVFPATWERVEGYREDETKSFGVPALENSISQFYASTTDLMDINWFKEKFESALKEYRYYDACNAANQIILIVEKNARIDIDLFEELTEELEEYNRHDYHQFLNDLRTYLERMGIIDVDHYIEIYEHKYSHYLNDFNIEEEYFEVSTKSFDEFFGLIELYWNEGFKAKYPGHLYDIYSIEEWDFDLRDYHLWAYDFSNGIILIPKIWVESKAAELQDAYIYKEVLNNLPLKSNIKTDLRGKALAIDPITKILDTNLKMSIESAPGYGKDSDTVVDYEITVPEGFKINGDSITYFSQKLSSDIAITVMQNDPSITLGVYFMELKIYVTKPDGSKQLCYQESIPFRIKGFSCIRFETFSSTNPIIPGDLFNAINVLNLGTIPENVKFTVEGIPENFIYKALYPDDFIDSSQYFFIYPGESRQSLIINPPRLYTTLPGLYSYNVIAMDPTNERIFDEYADSFIVSEFYDIDLKCSNPEISIFDNECGVYNFEITNLANVPQTFTINYDDLDFSVGTLSKTAITLDPGENDFFTLSLTPTSWGNQEYSIYATSEYNSAEIIASINIIDDDTSPPILSDLQIVDSALDVTVDFNVLNEIEGDDKGILNIKIYVDNELFVFYQPNPTETVFSFTFNNGWLLEYGTHEIRVEITDNDNDVVGDTLTTTAVDYFETTPSDIMEYTMWEMNELEDYIDHNVFFLYDWILINQVNAAEAKVQCALDWYNAGTQTKPVILDKLAKSNLDLLDIITTILDDWSLISEEDGDYISMESHDIRDHITLSMGAIVGTEPALDVANNIIDIEQLADQIFEEQNLWVSLSIDVHLWEAADNLDNALITMSMDSSTITIILEDISKANLKLADITTFLWEERGCMSESDSDYISRTLHSVRDSITLTMGEIVGTQAATDVSQIEVDIEQFADTIFEDYNLYTSLSIDLELWTASEYLDLALILISTGDTSGAETKLRSAIDQLENTKVKIIGLKNSGYLTESQVTQLHTQIDSYIAELTALCDHTLNQGCEEGSTDTNLHGDTSESSGDSSDSTSGSRDTTDPNTNLLTH